jgi:hypothetical protein
MKNQNLISLLLLFTLLFSGNANAQGVFGGPGPTLVVRAGSTINTTFIGPDPDIFSGFRMQSATIHINWIGVWPGNAMAAFSHARDIWEHSITSAVSIELDAHWTDLGATSGILGQAHAWTEIRDYGSSDWRYKPATWYPIALANKLNGTDLAPGSIDMEADFNSAFTDWYFGLDGNAPSTKYDFVTVVLHEIQHGLGFYSSAQEDNLGILNWAGNGYPNIFDWNIVNGSGTRLTTLPSTSAAVTSYLTSDNVFWDGMQAVSAIGTNAKLYVPTAWEQGSSMSHWNQPTFETTPHRLMCPYVSSGQGIHNSGPLGIAMLNDIGWDAILWIGIEDNIQVYNQGACCPYPYPTRILHEGGNYAYQMVFYDEDPYGDYLITEQWSIELLHRNGRYTLQTGAGSTYWNLTLNNLPTGYDWDRDINGRVRGFLVGNGMDNDNVWHLREIPIGVDYAPDQAAVNLKRLCSTYIPFDSKESELYPKESAWEIGEKVAIDVYSDWLDGVDYKTADIPKVTGDWMEWKEGAFNSGMNQINVENINVSLTNCCNAVTVNFFSQAATSYYVLYRKTNSLIFYMVQVPVGQFSQNIGGLDEFSNYIFYVCAVNSLGGTMSAPYYRTACKARNTNGDIFDKVVASPNPASDIVRVTLMDDEFKMTNIAIINMENPTIANFISCVSPENEMEVSLSGLPRGYYGILVKSENNFIYSTKIFKE